MTPEDILKRVLYRDALILILDKPSGIPVHKANGGKHNLEQYFHLLQFGLPKAPTLGHRLDRGTSGCLILARHVEAARRLRSLFVDNRIKKTYWAVTAEKFTSDEGRINLPLTKQSTSKRHWWMKTDPTGEISASTDYRVLGRGENITWLELSPQTGRTHQLRVHCAALGHPILGDYIYGPKGKTTVKDQLHLHARSLEVPLYPKKAPIQVTAPPPLHMLEALKSCGYEGEMNVNAPITISR